MGLIGGGRLDPDSTAPIVRTSHKPPKVWATVTVDGDSLVVRLQGWRAIWAAKRTLRVPMASGVRVEHDPGAYAHIKTKLRNTRRVRSTTFKLGAQHSVDGWSFWACGLARNAVVVETSGTRYRFIVAEVADPVSVVRIVRKAARIKLERPPPTVRPITDSQVLRWDPTSPPSTQASRGQSSNPSPNPSPKPKVSPKPKRKAEPDEGDAT